MDTTHWMTTITHALQQATAALTPARPIGDLLMPWVHDLSIAALAAAVATLGAVMLLELRALAALRRNVDSHLARVFEQLDLIRFDHVQLLEAHARQSTERAAAPAIRLPVATSSTPSNNASTAGPVAPAAVAAG